MRARRVSRRLGLFVALIALLVTVDALSQVTITYPRHGQSLTLHVGINLGALFTAGAVFAVGFGFAMQTSPRTSSAA